jgi:Fe-S cluster assembly ATPase SufC
MDPLTNAYCPLDNIIPSFKKSLNDKYVDYEKIMNFISAKQTSKTIDRHVAILEKLTRIYQSGVDIKEWGFVAKVIKIFRDKIIAGDLILLNHLKCLLNAIQYYKHVI